MEHKTFIKLLLHPIPVGCTIAHCTGTKLRHLIDKFCENCVYILAASHLHKPNICNTCTNFSQPVNDDPELSAEAKITSKRCNFPRPLEAKANGELAKQANLRGSNDLLRVSEEHRHWVSRSIQREEANKLCSWTLSASSFLHSRRTLRSGVTVPLPPSPSLFPSLKCAGPFA